LQPRGVVVDARCLTGLEGRAGHADAGFGRGVGGGDINRLGWRACDAAGGHAP